MSEWGETDRTVALGGAAARRAPHEARYGPDHRVPPEHDVDVRHQRLDLGMGLDEVGENQ